MATVNTFMKAGKPDLAKLRSVKGKRLLTKLTKDDLLQLTLALATYGQMLIDRARETK